MGTRQQLSEKEMVAMLRLLGDVRACGQNAALAARVLVDGLCGLVGADVGWIGELGRGDGRQWKPVNFAAGSYVDANLIGYMQSWGTQYPVECDLMAMAMTEDPDAQMVTTWADARQLAEPTQLEPFADLVKTLNIGDMANPGFRLGDNYLFAVNLQRRGLNCRPFGAKEMLLLEKVAGELRWMHETARLQLAIVTRRGATTSANEHLPPRLRQILDRLVAAKSPKEIARELGLSIWTIRDHIQRLYRHLGVESREELMARVLKDELGR